MKYWSLTSAIWRPFIQYNSFSNHTVTNTARWWLILRGKPVETIHHIIGDFQRPRWHEQYIWLGNIHTVHSVQKLVVRVGQPDTRVGFIVIWTHWKTNISFCLPKTLQMGRHQEHVGNLVAYPHSYTSYTDICHSISRSCHFLLSWWQKHTSTWTLQDSIC
jgi:hypothetical protein